MRSDASTTLRNLFLILLVLAVLSWLLPMPAESKSTFGIFFTLGALLAGFAWLWKSADNRDDAVPDVLARISDGYYERAGLCFLPRLSVGDGLCWFDLYCQNQHELPCSATICVIPMEGMCATEPNDVPPIIADIECDGGEVAMVGFPYPIAKKWQGKIMVYDVYATVRYPAGRGERLRVGKGVLVPELGAEMADLLKTAALLAVGVVRIKNSAASCELTLPENVSDAEPSGVAQRSEVLWSLDRPTGGFPIRE